MFFNRFVNRVLIIAISNGHDLSRSPANLFSVYSWEIDDIARNEWHNKNANYNCGTTVQNSSLARAIASIEARNGLVRIKI